jgi:hypothetical protein
MQERVLPVRSIAAWGARVETRVGRDRVLVVDPVPERGQRLLGDRGVRDDAIAALIENAVTATGDPVSSRAVTNALAASRTAPV